MKIYRDDVLCNNNAEHIIDLNTDVHIKIELNTVPPKESDSPFARLAWAFLCEPCIKEINAKGVQNWEPEKGMVY